MNKCGVISEPEHETAVFVLAAYSTFSTFFDVFRCSSVSRLRLPQARLVPPSCLRLTPLVRATSISPGRVELGSGRSAPERVCSEGVKATAKRSHEKARRWEQLLCTSPHRRCCVFEAKTQATTVCTPCISLRPDVALRGSISVQRRRCCSIASSDRA